jgi:aconitase A
LERIGFSRDDLITTDHISQLAQLRETLPAGFDLQGASVRFNRMVTACNDRATRGTFANIRLKNRMLLREWRQVICIPEPSERH